MDHLNQKQRSWNMRQIKSKDTLPEIRVRKWLFSKGYRFRKNDKRYPGKPDIVMPKYNTIIFVHGCFWHRHLNCKYASVPKTNTDYWEKKFNRNIENDIKNSKELKEQGWSIITIWECELKPKVFEETMRLLEQQIILNGRKSREK